MANQTIELGQGIKVRVNGSKLTIECDLDADFGQTASGNTRHASTMGNASLAQLKRANTFVGLNVYTKANK